jgi:outer membrane protein assembly factor BamE (lipoprotein component of BamABCDE complex)
MKIGYSIFICVIVTLSSCNDHSFSDVSFNSEKWKSGDRKVKGSMVDHLIADSIIVGKTKNEVFRLLGDPTASDTTDQWVYEVDLNKKTGPMGLGGIWLFYLNIRFDTLSNRVLEVRCTD